MLDADRREARGDIGRVRERADVPERTLRLRAMQIVSPRSRGWSVHLLEEQQHVCFDTREPRDLRSSSGRPDLEVPVDRLCGVYRVEPDVMQLRHRCRDRLLGVDPAHNRNECHHECDRNPSHYATASSRRGTRLGLEPSPTRCCCARPSQTPSTPHTIARGMVTATNAVSPMARPRNIPSTWEPTTSPTR